MSAELSAASLPLARSSSEPVAHGRRWPWPLRFVRACILLGLWALALSVGMGYWGRGSWEFELFVHWTPAAGWIALAGLPLAIWWQRHVLSLVLVIVLARAVYLVWPLLDLPSPAAPPPLSGGVPLTVASVNLLCGRGATDTLFSWAQSTKPDLIGIQEFTPELEVVQERARDLYPHWVTKPAPGTTGIALASVHPIVQSRFLYARADLPQIEAVVDVEGRHLRVFVVHTFPPLSSTSVRMNQSFLTQLSASIRESREPVLVIGDFNLTPWSECFRSFRATSGLSDGRRGLGVRPTWPSTPLVRVLGIPIDHILAEPPLVVTSIDVGPEIGSDHLPLISRIVWPR